MTIRHLKVFIAVAQTGKMGAAAKELYISQPTVSQVISEIEEQYGVKLFERLSKKLYITKEGRQLLDYARHIIALFDEMERNLSYASTHHALRVGATITVGSCALPSIIRRFEERHPTVTTQVWVDNTQVIEGMILESRLDLALVEGEVASPDLIVRPVLEDELVLICGPCNPFAGRQSVALSELSGQDFILREPGSGTREVVDALLVTAEVQITPLWESTSTRSIINAVKENIGISILPYELVKNEIQSGAVAGLPLASPLPNRTCSIIHHRNKYLTPSAQAFIEVCQEYSNLSTESFQTEEERQSSTE